MQKKQFLLPFCWRFVDFFLIAVALGRVRVNTPKIQFWHSAPKGGRSTPPFFRSAPLKFLTKNQKPIQKQDPNSKNQTRCSEKSLDWRSAERSLRLKTAPRFNSAQDRRNPFTQTQIVLGGHALRSKLI